MFGDDRIEEMRKLAWELLDVKERARNQLITTNSNLVGVLIGVSPNGVVVDLIGILEFYLEHLGIYILD